MKQLKLLSNLRDPLHFSIFFGASAIFFSVSYLVMATLPGERELMCVIGGGLTAGNIVFALILSLAVGFILAGYVGIIRAGYFRNRVAIGSLSGSAFVLGVLTLFCTLCAIPLVSFFGLSLVLWFVGGHIFWFQLLTLSFMGLALYLMEFQLRGQCINFNIRRFFRRFIS